MSEQKKQPGDFTGDPHWGKGGRYVVDVTNGQRIPVAKKESDAVATEEDATGTGKAKTVKEAKRA